MDSSLITRPPALRHTTLPPPLLGQGARIIPCWVWCGRLSLPWGQDPISYFGMTQWGKSFWTLPVCFTTVESNAPGPDSFFVILDIWPCSCALATSHAAPFDE